MEKQVALLGVRGRHEPLGCECNNREITIFEN